MKIVAVLGSSRKDSVSAKLVNQILEGAKKNANEAVIYDVNKMNLKGCMGCGACRKNNSDCVIQDDIHKYFKDLREAGALIVSSPNYYSQICGQMITFMNRHYCLMDAQRNVRIPEGIKLVGVFAQGAKEGYDKYLANYDWYLSTFTGKKMELVGKVIAGGDSDLSESGKLMKQAFEIGESL